jgi:hypothetical protein
LSWAEIIDVVAAGLEARQLPDAEGDPEHPVSLLAAVTGSVPPGLRRRLQHQPPSPDAASDDVEPLIYQNEFGVRLVADGLVDVATQAVAGRCGPRGPRVTGIVAAAALSTLRLDPAEKAAAWLHVHRRISMFGAPLWTEALDCLASRTAELNDELTAAADGRRQVWDRVTPEDRILAEAVAAAVVGGAAQASGVPPQRWLLPFHLFCGLAVSAARSSLTTIEHWLGIEFLPAPRSAQRAAGLATLVADEAAALWRGCGCKAAAQEGELAFARRGSCRQDDHDLRAWRPGQRKPGSRGGARYASTLWGWQRRWLGGTDFGRAAAADAARPTLRPNDVASSVLARRWLYADRGFGGPVLRYDRILPEFCLRCGSKVRLTSVPGPAGRMVVRRAACCPQQQLVYQSEFIWRGGRRLLRPKLGLVVASQSDEGGNAGYGSTEPLGPIWVCRASGRYSCSGHYCPECGPGQDRMHERVHHGWVLLPLAGAWADLRATAGLDDLPTAGPPADDAVGHADLRFLADVCGQLPPGTQRQFEAPADAWALAKGWSSAEMNRFSDLAGLPGLELLLRCRRIAETHAAGSRPGGERIVRGD